MSHLYIRQCKLKPVKDGKVVPNWALSSLYPDHAKVDGALMRLIALMDGDIRQGSAPARPVERQLQTDIDALTARLGNGKGKGKAKGSADGE